MTTELSTLKDMLAPSEDNATALSEFKSMKAFLPSIRLMQALSGPVTTKKAESGDFLLFSKSDAFEKLGAQFTVVPLIFRFKALVFGDQVLSYYNVQSPEFADVRARADADKANSGCLWGPEFLVWLPDMTKFATFHLTSDTLRGQAKPMQALVTQPSIITSELITSKKTKKSWYGFNINVTSDEVAMPSEAEVMAEVAAFKSAKDSVIEVADPSSGDAGRAR